jgi:hypothetical protein
MRGVRYRLHGNLPQREVLSGLSSGGNGGYSRKGTEREERT